ncbi:MAG TPA: hypothetical protein VFS50_06845 [Meiothermus sp.]|nr:hypothetical protein [Meiothermus sp.]
MYYGMIRIVPVRWRFAELLQKEGITVYRLYKQVALKDVSRTSLYKWAQSMPKYLDVDMAERVLEGLKEITGRDYQLSDLIEVTTKSSEPR